MVEHYTKVPDQPLVFIGHSWGAMYATWFIHEYGDYDEYGTRWTTLQDVEGNEFCVA